MSTVVGTTAPPTTPDRPATADPGPLGPAAPAMTTMVLSCSVRSPGPPG